jgi:hypothetical protein
MSDPKDVSRPRTPLTISPKAPRPATSREEMARKLYGPDTVLSDARALAEKASIGVKPLGIDAAATLAAALSVTAPALSDELTRFFPGTDELGILRDPNAGLGSAAFGLGGQGSHPLNEIPGVGVSTTTDFGGPSDKYQRFTLKRDRDRPLAFDGRIVAEVEEQQHSGQVVIRAAIYETQGGKFVTEMTRREMKPPVNYGVGKRPFLFAKATVFESLDIAAMSFRTHGGRLTEELLRQIGDVDPEFIE